MTGANVHAAITTFFGEDLNPGGIVPMGGNAATARSNFLAALSGGVGTEDFESFGLGHIAASGLDLSFPGSTGNITATLTGGGPAEIIEPNSGRFATSGTKFLETDGGSNFNIAFSSQISAFGFFGTDIGDFGGQIVLSLSGVGMQSINIGNSTNAPDGSLLFFGFTDPVDTYSNIAFSHTGGAGFFGFDDMTIGDQQQLTMPPVPVPATVWLVGTGLFGLMGMRKKKASA